MYPTVVILLVETQRSMTDICEIGPSNPSKLAGPVGSEARHATFGHLSFAVRTVHLSMMDNEAESQHSRALQSQDGQEDDLEEDILEVKAEESQVPDRYHYNLRRSIQVQHYIPATA